MLAKLNKIKPVLITLLLLSWLTLDLANAQEPPETPVVSPSPEVTHPVEIGKETEATLTPAPTPTPEPVLVETPPPVTLIAPLPTPSKSPAEIEQEHAEKERKEREEQEKARIRALARNYNLTNGEPTAAAIDAWLARYHSPIIQEAPPGKTIGQIFLEMGPQIRH
jgi:outer membrane biosynthesis protein TonB